MKTRREYLSGTLQTVGYGFMAAAFFRDFNQLAEYCMGAFGVSCMVGGYYVLKATEA